MCRRRQARAERWWLVATMLAVSLPNVGAAQFMTGRRVERDRLQEETRQSARQLVEQVGFDQHLGGALPLELSFRDENGAAVRLGDYFRGKPVILGLVYYRCPVLCTLVERGLASGLKPLDLTPGREFEVVFVSIDPTDDATTASERKRAILDSYGHSETAAGWHFLTGEPQAIEQLAGAAGFRYAFDASTGQYAHAAGLTIATPEGRLARYLFGVDFAPRDLKFALVDASGGKIGSPIDKALLICFRYDAGLGKYTAATLTILKIAATLTLIAMGSFLFFALRRERRNRELAVGGHA